jgi:type III secretion protein J
MQIQLNMYHRLKNICLVFSLSFWIIACSNSSHALLDGLSQTSANNVISTLYKHGGIVATKRLDENGKYSIFVVPELEMNALQILKKYNLPQKSLQSFGDIFKKDSFISSPIEEQARYIDALNQEISDMLLHLDGVVSVKAEVSLPPVTDKIWQGDVINSSASVIIRYQPEYRINLYTNTIKKLVANSVPGLIPDRVEVLSIPIYE